MSPNKRKLVVIVPIAVAALILFGFWLSGFNFDKRGSDLAVCYFMTISLTGISIIAIVTYPDD